MLTSQLGVRLILWMGDSVPLPAPVEALSALTRVEVTNDAQSGDGFQITFTLSKNQPTDYSLLQGGALKPGTRVIIGVLMGFIPEVLIDGIITHHQHAPSSDPGSSTLTVTGKDVSIMLDLEEKNAKYENQADFLIVAQLIASYAKYGLIPKVTPTTDFPIMLNRIPRQHETDLKFIQRMGDRNGFVFYVEPLTFGVNSAYWGPEIRLGVPQPALTLGAGPAGNLKSLNFSQDALASVNTKGTFVEPFTKTAIPIPQLPSLRIPPLASSPAEALRTVLMRDTSNQNPAQAATSALARATTAPDPVTGQGEVESVRYGNVLRARKLVGVRGAGLSYDGNYYVRRVTHTITRGDYKQSFTLSREGDGLDPPGGHTMSDQFFGKYRGNVTDIQDPLMTGRVRAKVPDVMGDQESGWAMPCLPFAGDGMGFFALPKVGAGVWIEFEHGDPDYPIWSGCWIGALSEAPSDWLTPPYKKVILKTEGGHSIILDDTPGIGGITLQTSGGQKIVMNATSIEITNGQGGTIKMSGPQVSINSGALEVT